MATIIADDLNCAMECAMVGGRHAMTLFRKNAPIDRKIDFSPVTIADQETENAMREFLYFQRPLDEIYGEEEGGVLNSTGRLWIIDPIDGTRSFITGNPLWGVMVSLVENGVPKIGVCYFPYFDDIYYAEMGVGVWFNGYRLAQEKHSIPLNEHLCTATSPNIFDNAAYKKFHRLSLMCKETRFGGDCAMYCWLVHGMPIVVCESGLKVYDFCALAPIVMMAGYSFTDWKGQEITLKSDGKVLAIEPRYLDFALDYLIDPLEV